MPKLHTYVGKRGSYIRTNINGNHVTFQVTSGGEHVLNDMGYKNGSNVPWAVISPLHKRGAIYTNKTGIDQSAIGDMSDEDQTNLNPSQRERLNNFIANSNVSRVVLEQLKRAITDLLDLSMIALAEREMNELALSDMLLESIDEFRNVGMNIKSLSTPSPQVFLYELSKCTDGDAWMTSVADTRFSAKPDYEFRMTMEGSKGQTKTVYIDGGYGVELLANGETVDLSGPPEERHREIKTRSPVLDQARQIFRNHPTYAIKP